MNPYAPPEVLDAEFVNQDEYLFSERFRRKTESRVSFVILAICLVLPSILLAFGIPLGFLNPGWAPWIWATLVAVTTIQIMFMAMGLLALSGFQGLRRALARRLASDNLDPDQWNGQFVQLSPADRPLIYDRFTNWDVGFLLLFQDRLVYLGDRVRFSLRRDEVMLTALGASAMNPFHPPNLYFRWESTERGQGVFALGLGEGNSLKKLRRSTPLFAKQIALWKGGELPLTDESTEKWNAFPLPPTGVSEGQTYFEANNAFHMAFGGGVLAVLSAFVSVVTLRSLGVGLAECFPGCLAAAAPIVYLTFSDLVFGWVGERRWRSADEADERITPVPSR